MTTDDTIKTDIVSSLQFLVKKDVEKTNTDENALAVEDAAAKLRNMTLRGNVVFCGYRSS